MTLTDQLPLSMEDEDKEDLSLLDTAPGPEKQVLLVGVLRKDLEWDNVMTCRKCEDFGILGPRIDWPESGPYIDSDVNPRTVKPPKYLTTKRSKRSGQVRFTCPDDTIKEIWSTLFFVLAVSLVLFFSWQGPPPRSTAPYHYCEAA